MQSLPTISELQELRQFLTPQELEEIDRLIATRPKCPDFRNHAKAIQSIRRSDEFLLSGPYETGKTFAALWFLDTLLREYPGSRAAILRKTRSTMDSTVLETWRNVIAIRGGVEPFGGNKPQWYDYSNGSRAYIGGLDDPGKTLSGERDWIYVNQTEELQREDWETLSTRATGRASHAFEQDGETPIAILFGDCNPGGPVHWILQRPSLRLLPTTHEDNPTLFDNDGKLTPRGKQTIEKLDALTGAQYQRGRLGKWFASEGIILEDWRDEIGHPLSNVTYEAEYVPDAGPVILGGDDGYSGEIDERINYFKPQSHPRVFLLAQLRNTGQLNVFYESFKIKTLHRDHIAELLETCRQNGWPVPDYAVIDKSATTLKREIWENGITFYNGANSVEESLKELLSWIKPDVNNFIRLLVHPRCEKTRLEARLYARDKEGKIIKDFDHSWDILRYITNRLRFEKVAA